jgi:protein O-GlcNAc transferase
LPVDVSQPDAPAEQVAGALFHQAMNAHQARRLSLAVTLYRRVLVHAPGHDAALINLAAVSDDLDPIYLLHRAALLVGPNPRGYINLGNRLEREGSDGTRSYQRAVLALPSDELGHRRLAAARGDREGDDHGAAETHYRRALRCDPASPSALMGLGNLHRRAGRVMAAHDCHSIAARLSPGDWRPVYNIAVCLSDAGNPRTAERWFWQALRKSSDPVEPLTQFARHHLERQQPVQAGALFSKALLIRPAAPELLAGLAKSVIGHDPTLGRRLFRYSSRAVSQDGRALSELGQQLWQAGEHEASRDCLERVVAALPGHADPHANLAQALSRLWYGRPALRASRRATILAPAQSRHWSLVGLAHTRFAEIDLALLNYRRARIVEPRADGYVSTELFTILYSDCISAIEKAARHRTLGASLMPSTRPTSSRAQATRSGTAKIRVGYVSPDLAGNHPVALFAHPLFKHHDHGRFDIHVYETNEGRDETTGAVQAMADHWRHFRGWRTERIVRAIQDDGIDILVDLCGHTAGNRLDVFAAGAASVQVGFIGYPHSTGLPAMTHLLADSIVAPPALDHLFSEAVVRLPQCVFCVDPETLPVAIDPSLVERRQSVVFGSFNNSPKIGPRTIALWSKVLKAVPDSVLRLKAASFRDPEYPAHCRRLFGAQGVAPDRLILVEPSGFQDLLAEYAEVDIALDPIVYNGGTTTCQALWMGVPVVTLAGENFCGRMGASILGHAGLAEWVGLSEDEYVDIARSLASDREALVSLRRGLRPRLTATSFSDGAAYTRAVEAAFITMVGRA